MTRKILSIWAGCFFVAGLSLQAQANVELTRASVVVVAQPEFSVKGVKAMSWAESHANVSKGFLQSEFSVSKLIDGAITKALKKKSYEINSGANPLSIRYYVSLASEMDDTAILRKFGLSPGLRSNDHTKDHERGTLVIELLDPALKNKAVWRGAAEVFVGIEDTEQGRQDRVNHLVDELFNRIPARK